MKEKRILNFGLTTAPLGILRGMCKFKEIWVETNIVFEAWSISALNTQHLVLYSSASCRE